MDVNNRSLSTRQVAQMLGVSTGSVANWIDEGSLRAGRTPGGHRRVAVADLLQFLRRQGLPVPAELNPPPTRILIVDDESNVRQYIATIIRAAYPDHEILEAADGFAAGEQVGAGRPDLVILDLSMPDLDGFEVCLRIKTNPATAGTQVIAITGEFTADREARIRKAGARVCLPKPLVASDLLKQIELALGE